MVYDFQRVLDTMRSKTVDQPNYSVIFRIMIEIKPGIGQRRIANNLDLVIVDTSPLRIKIGEFFIRLASAKRVRRFHCPDFAAVIGHERDDVILRILILLWY